MKAAYIEKTGPPENIIFGDQPMPEASEAQVVVQVAAVAVNPIDTYIRAGRVDLELPLPFIVGCDLAGTVEAIGPKVERFKVGDRVWGTNQGLLGRQGTFAEYVAVDECWLYPLPGGVDEKTAAGGALVAVTAHLGLFRDAKLTAGETIFVHGGSGGIGSTVVQMAKAVGAKVLTSGGSDEKVSKCIQLGADAAFNYKNLDILRAIEQATDGRGVDVFWETQREPNFDEIVAALAPRGRIIVMAGRETRPEFPVGPFYVKGCSMHGFAMFAASHDEQRRCSDQINTWLSEGKLKPNIDRILPLSETAAAHRLQEENTIQNVGTLSGKIVLTPL